MKTVPLHPINYSPAPEAGPVVEAVQSAFKTSIEAAAPQDRVLYDTFDWRLYKRRETLWRSRTSAEMVMRWETWDGSRIGVDIPDVTPEFAWSFPEGSFRQALTPVVEMRRLFPILEFRSSSQMLSILDSRDKTVARISFRTVWIRKIGKKRWSDPLPLSVQAIPIRGYVKVFRQLRKLLEGQLKLKEESAGLFEKVISLAYPEAGKYSSKPNILLEPDLRSDEATKRILTELLDTMLVNEEGTRLDWDSEFLHDFRVSGRRTRSALTQIKGVFPARVVDRFKRGFKWLGNITGPTRDLDVYLLKMPDYQQSLPEAARDDLAPLVEFLKRHQREEQARLSEALESVRYLRMVQAWRRFLNEPVPVRTSLKNARRPILELASERIWKAFRRVTRKGRAVTSESPAVLLHDLRIDCKKLRYLLEFFRTLYDPAEMKRLIQSLKGLQDCLGDFNDYEVQQNSLKGFAEQMLSEGVVAAPTLLSMGCLIDQFEQGQSKEKLRFEEMFGLFANPENEDRCRRLFRGTAAPRRRSE